MEIGIKVMELWTSMQAPRAPTHLPLQRAVPHSKTTFGTLEMKFLVLSSMIPHVLQSLRFLRAGKTMLDIYLCVMLLYVVHI